MQTIQQIIDKALEPQPRERSGKFSPSSFGGCFRKQIWNRRDEPKSNPPDSRTLRVFEAGHIFEKFVVDLLPEPKELQVLVEEDDVKGYADIVFDNEVVDIKSQNSKAFWYMKKWGKKGIVEEKRHNWLQVGYYAWRLQKDFIRLVFVSKDDLCIAEYVQNAIEWAIPVETELEALRYLWKKGDLPPAKPRLFPQKDGTYKECEYCDWHDLCQKIEREDNV